MFGTASNAVASHRGVSHKALLKVLFLLALIHSQPLRRWLKLGHSKKGHQPFMFHFKHLCDCIMTKEDSETLIYKPWTHISILYRYIEQNIFHFTVILYCDYMTYKNFKAWSKRRVYNTVYKQFSHKSCWMSKPVGVRDFLGVGNDWETVWKLLGLDPRDLYTINPQHQSNAQRGYVCPLHNEIMRAIAIDLNKSFYLK